MNWLLLRGLAREQRHWHGFPDRFRARTNAGEVVLVDVAGVGTEHRRLPHPSVEWMARDVVRRVPGWAAREAAPSSWSVVGLSLGGMIALELCRLYPGRVQRAVIVNASSRLTNARARLLPGAARELARASVCRDPVSRERLVLGLTSALPEPERLHYARLAADFARDAPASRWSVLAQLLAAARFAPPESAALTTRLRFVCARNDALVSPRCTRDLAAWYGVESDEHPWAGHDLPLDDPEWLCERVARFAASTDAARIR